MRITILMCVSSIFCITGRAQTFINFTINQDPVVTADAGAGSTICDGATANLTGLAGGGNGSYTYQWNPSGSVTSPTNDITTASPSATTVYTLTVTDGNQCSQTDTVLVTLPALPLIADAGTGISLCTAGNTNLSGNASGGYGGYSYIWSPGSTLSDSTALNPTAGVTGTTTFTLTVTDANLCTQTDLVTINLPASVLSVDAGIGGTICLGNIINLSGGATGGYGSYVYDWTPGGTLSDSTIVNPVAIPTGNITYHLEVTDANNCIQGDDVVVNVVDCSGLEEENASGFSIYPNPNNGMFYLSINDEQSGSTIKILTTQGDLIYQRNLNAQGNYMIQLDKVASGIYLIVLDNANGNMSSQKLIIQ